MRLPSEFMTAPILHVAGPSGAGPGERARMLETAASFLEDQGVAHPDVVRIDVPGRGAGEEGDSVLRTELEPVIPILQSGSLFGGKQGLQVVDAQRLRTGEAEVIASLLATIDPEAVAVVFVSEGALPATLSKFVKAEGSSRRIDKLWERDASTWLHEEIHRRQLALDGGAAAALIQRFGADVASLGQALDQLAEVSGKIKSEDVLDRFRNRPNEPIFHYTDAIAKGDTAEALRRLGDLLTHLPALVILSALETEVRRRALALSASDESELAKMAGAASRDKWVGRVWRQRGQLKDSSLRKAVDALVRADRVLKTSPEEMHQVTLERLTVAMCRWLSGR